MVAYKIENINNIENIIDIYSIIRLEHYNGSTDILIPGKYSYIEYHYGVEMHKIIGDYLSYSTTIKKETLVKLLRNNTINEILI